LSGFCQGCGTGFLNRPSVQPFVRQITAGVRSGGLNRSEKLIEVLKMPEFMGYSDTSADKTSDWAPAYHTAINGGFEVRHGRKWASRQPCYFILYSNDLNPRSICRERD
jgi:hypothetical protein